MGWGDPFGRAFFAFAGAPAVFVNETVVRPASEGEIVDVGQPPDGPVFFGMMNLAAITGHGAAGVATSAVGGMKVPVVHPRRGVPAQQVRILPGAQSFKQVKGYFW